jgi:hypothetical protein
LSILDACINVVGLLIDSTFSSTMITPKQAYEYVKLFTQFDFACGAGMSRTTLFVVFSAANSILSIYEQLQLHVQCDSGTKRNFGRLCDNFRQ